MDVKSRQTEGGNRLAESGIRHSGRHRYLAGRLAGPALCRCQCGITDLLRSGGTDRHRHYHPGQPDGLSQDRRTGDTVMEWFVAGVFAVFIGGLIWVSVDAIRHDHKS